MFRSSSHRPALRVVEPAPAEGSAAFPGAGPFPEAGPAGALVSEPGLSGPEMAEPAVSDRIAAERSVPEPREEGAPSGPRAVSRGPAGAFGSGAPASGLIGSSLETLGDAQLVALSRAGDRGAFEALYRRHAAFALNLAVRIQGGVGDVEDIVHDAFLRAHDRLDDLREDAAFRGWLGSIVVRLVRSRLRRGRFLGTLGIGGQDSIDLDALAAETAGPETRALLAQIYGVLRRLPVDQRIAWTLRYVERHTLPDVAQMVDCSLATVKRRIGAAQAVLDAAFSERGGTRG